MQHIQNTTKLSRTFSSTHQSSNKNTNRKVFPKHKFIIFLIRIALITLAILWLDASLRAADYDLDVWMRNFVQNFLAELLGIVFTVLVLDTLSSTGKLQLENVVMKIDQAVDQIDEAVEEKLHSTIEAVAASETKLDELQEALRHSQLQLATISAQMAILRHNNAIAFNHNGDETP